MERINGKLWRQREKLKAKEKYVERRIGKVARVLPARRSHLTDLCIREIAKKRSSGVGLFNDYTM